MTLVEFLKKNEQVAKIVQFSGMVGKAPTGRLSSTETTQLEGTVRLSMNQLMTLRSFLKRNRIDLMPSVWSFRRASQALALKTPLERLKVTIMEEGQEKTTTAFVAKDLRGFIVETWNRCCRFTTILDDDRFLKKIRIGFGADKGAGETKAVISYQNVASPNSVRNMFIVGFYEGSDSACNLRSAFQPISDQFPQLEPLLLDYPLENGVVEKRSIEVYAFGDYACICGLVGHDGPSASYPCILCYVQLAQLQNPAIDDQAEPRRTLVEIRAHAIEYAAMQREKGSRVSSKATRSISNQPLLPIPIENYAPPVLHILRGSTQCIFDEMVETAGELDSSDIPSTSAGRHEGGAKTKLQRKHKMHVKEASEKEQLREELEGKQQKLIAVLHALKQSPVARSPSIPEPMPSISVH